MRKPMCLPAPWNNACHAIPGTLRKSFRGWWEEWGEADILAGRGRLEDFPGAHDGAGVGVVAEGLVVVDVGGGAVEGDGAADDGAVELAGVEDDVGLGSVDAGVEGGISAHADF